MSAAQQKIDSLRKASFLSGELKGKCVEYVKNHLSEDLEKYQLENFASRISDEADKETGKPIVEFESDEEMQTCLVESLDKFLLFGKTQSEQKVLERIRLKSSNFSKEEKAALEEWEQKAVSSIFEVMTIGWDYFDLVDITNGMEYTVFLNVGKFVPELFLDIKIGDFLHSNIAPTQGFWFFSGGQLNIPKEKGKYLFEKIIRQGKIGRNEPCPCGSDKKFKHCHGK